MEGIQPTFPIGGNDAFGNSGIWLFAILALMWGGGGMFGGRNGACATTEDLATQSNFTRLEAQGTALSQAIAAGFTNVGNGICNSTYELKTTIDALSREMLNQCCGLSKEINAIAAKLDADKIEALQNKVNELQLQQALCGVVRYPTQTTFAATNPFCGCSNPNI